MLSTNLSAADQAQLDQMRDDDAGSPGVDQPAAPEPQEQEQVQEQGSQPEQRRTTMVPHQALHEEREARKRLERDLQAEREARALLDQRTNLILQHMGQRQQPAPEEPAIPTLEQDPVGHFVAKQTALEQQVREGSLQQQQQQQAIAQHVQMLAIQQAITRRAQGMEAEFQAEHVDYPDAVQHLMQVRHKELELLGMDAGQRIATVQQEGMELAAHAFRTNQNPAAVIYELAKMRGYGSAAQPSASQAGQQPAASTQRLESVAAGQRQSRSLGDMRGSPPVQMNGDRLAKMSNEEFTEWYSKNFNTADGRALFGG